MRTGSAFMLAVLLLASLPARLQAQTVSAGYARITGSVVKVWALDSHGAPIISGTGLVVDSTFDAATILTVARLVRDAVTIRVDVDATVRDLVATVSAKSPDGVALLKIKHGKLPAATFSMHPVLVGDTIASAGYFSDDEGGALIQHLLYPGTVSAIIRDDKVVELDNLNVRDGVGGAPVFDPATGNVVGLVSSRSSSGTGGYAISGRLVLVPFLTDQHVRLALETPAPAPVRTTAAVAVARASATPAPAHSVLPVTPSPAPSTKVAVAATAAVTPPPRLGRKPPGTQTWVPMDGLPGVSWLWINDGYGTDGQQTVDLYAFNDYAQTVFFYPEVHYTAGGKTTSVYFNSQRVFKLESGKLGQFPLRFPAPSAQKDIFITMHDVRFGTDTGPFFLPR